MDTLNPIKPNMREKKRYLCFIVHGNFPKRSVQDAILSRIKRWIGEKDFALARVNFMQSLYDETNSAGIISCNVQQYMDVRMGIMLTDEIDTVKTKVDVFFASGIIKKAKAKIKEKIDENKKNSN